MYRKLATIDVEKSVPKQDRVRNARWVLPFICCGVTFKTLQFHFERLQLLDDGQFVVVACLDTFVGHKGNGHHHLLALVCLEDRVEREKARQVDTMITLLNFCPTCQLFVFGGKARLVHIKVVGSVRNLPFLLP